MGRTLGRNWGGNPGVNRPDRGCGRWGGLANGAPDEVSESILPRRSRSGRGIPRDWSSAAGPTDRIRKNPPTRRMRPAGAPLPVGVCRDERPSPIRARTPRLAGASTRPQRQGDARPRRGLEPRQGHRAARSLEDRYDQPPLRPVHHRVPPGPGPVRQRDHGDAPGRIGRAPDDLQHAAARPVEDPAHGRDRRPQGVRIPAVHDQRRPGAPEPAPDPEWPHDTAPRRRIRATSWRSTPSTPPTPSTPRGRPFSSTSSDPGIRPPRRSIDIR